MLAAIQDEPGGRIVDRLLPRAAVSTVNVAEAAGRLIDHGMPPAEARAILEGMGFQQVSVFDLATAFRAAELRSALPRGLSLGDRACLALAIELKVTAYTTDSAWTELKLPALRVQLLR